MTANVLESEPTGAEVIAPAGRVGVTPYKMTVHPGGEQKLRLQKAGYRPVERRIGTQADATIAVQLEPIPPASRARSRRGRSGQEAGRRSALDSSAGTLAPFGA